MCHFLKITHFCILYKDKINLGLHNCGIDRQEVVKL